MVSFPPCKINLGLNVLRKRSDGYHDIETCFYPIGWSDILEVIPSHAFAFTTSGESIPGELSENLCVRAYHLLQNEFHLPPVHIHLHKILPTGAGLGGGSSDAAWTLRLLNEIFELKLSNEVLSQKAARLGSDCAFFIGDVPMLGTGRGEVLTPIDVSLKGMYLALVKPEVHISTAQAYAGIVPHQPVDSLTEVLKLPFEAWRERLKNDFEQTVFHKFPVVGEVKHALYASGAVYACMSGSGSAVFGIFTDRPQLPAFDNATVWLSDELR